LLAAEDVALVVLLPAVGDWVMVVVPVPVVVVWALVVPAGAPA
jgi:hypothetical protein